MDDLTQEQMEGMSMEDLQRLMEGGEQAPEVQPEQPDEAVQDPAESAEPQEAQPEAHVEQAAAPRGVPDDRFAQMREQQRALEEARQQLAAYEAALQDPARVRAHLQALVPEEAPSFDDDPDAALDARLAPVLTRLQQLEAENHGHRQAAAHRALMDEMHAKHGPDFAATVAAFDRDNEHLRSQHPEVRYFAELGRRAKFQPSDPKADEARINAAAEAKLAAILASGKGGQARGIPTLGDVPSARESRQAPSLDSLSQQDMERMSASELQALLRGGG